MVKLLNVSETNQLIRTGQLLFISADNSILEKLETGNWIAGSIPYFMGPNGGESTKTQALVTILPSYILSFEIVEYFHSDLHQIPEDYFSNGFSLIVMPTQSDVHLEFSKNSFNYQNIFSGNLVGWVSGADLSDPKATPPSVYNGLNPGGPLFNKAVVLHAELPAGKYAKTSIVNIFDQNPSSDIIEFDAPSYIVSECLVNGVKTNFASYLKKTAFDTRFPLVADYSGARINVSFKDINTDRQEVSFYAPVFPMVKYRVANTISDYESAFSSKLEEINNKTPIFSCNCILNYLYSNLEGKHCGAQGPITFGEIAYILLNQTLVYLFIEDHPG